MSKLTSHDQLEMAAIEAMYMVKALSDELGASPEEALPLLRYYGFVSKPSRAYTFNYCKWSTKLKQFNMAKYAPFNPPDGIWLKPLSCPVSDYRDGRTKYATASIVRIQGGSVTDVLRMNGLQAYGFDKGDFVERFDQWRYVADLIIIEGRVL